MPREPHTQLCQWPMPNGSIMTTVHHIDDDGEETVELTGVFEPVHLTLEDRGHEMILPERAR
jgi:hypothetical protein